MTDTKDLSGVPAGAPTGAGEGGGRRKLAGGPAGPPEMSGSPLPFQMPASLEVNADPLPYGGDAVALPMPKPMPVDGGWGARPSPQIDPKGGMGDLASILRDLDHRGRPGGVGGAAPPQRPPAPVASQSPNSGVLQRLLMMLGLK
jgi:hypothetical protein